MCAEGFLPQVQVTIGGSKVSLRFDAIVDTGFTGFIVMPLVTAIPLGLELDGIKDYITADGARQDWPTALATIEFEGQVVEQSVTLSYTGDEILLGLRFLLAFDQSLIIHRDQLILVDSSTVEPLLAGLH